VILEAPGKVFLAGEYAVLEQGEPALVAGIDRALHAEWAPAEAIELLHRPSGAFAGLGGPAPAELRFALSGVRAALDFCGTSRPFRLVYLDDFALGGRKLGLGGSAAATVLAVRAACAAQGRAATSAEILALARAAHAAAQGGVGRGADVAACALGGLLEVRRQGTSLETTRAAAPADLRLLLAFTGRSADSRALVGEVRAFAAARPGRWRDHVRSISAACLALRDALAAAAREPAAGAAASDSTPAAAAPDSTPGAAAPDSPARAAALDAVRRGAAAMAALGAEAQVPIVTEELAHACALAASAGAAAKPSGAGGGDCAVALCFGDDAAARVEATLGRTFQVLRVSASAATIEAQ
jgi:phosphomevalonate kinase